MRTKVHDGPDNHNELMIMMIVMKMIKMKMKIMMITKMMMKVCNDDDYLVMKVIH